MEYIDVERFLNGIARLGYRPFYAVYGEFFDMMFFTNGFQIVILQNLGAFRGMKIFHSSALKSVVEEIERVQIQEKRYF
ncbi:MAG: hypothetical protein KAR20_01230 [Candidatus Heimdallarchaeota archaeon]|nr:hypothetical protein [Candidatus Heimdallarchaeota archaeon]